MARGRSRSSTISQTIKMARDIAVSGAKEIILTGVNIGDFGTNHNEDLLGLMHELVDLDGALEAQVVGNLLPDRRTRGLGAHGCPTGHHVGLVRIELGAGVGRTGVRGETLVMGRGMAVSVDGGRRREHHAA